MLGDLELKNDDWVKAKETYRAASEATEGKDSYATLSLVCIISTVHASLSSHQISWYHVNSNSCCLHMLCISGNFFFFFPY